jgi:RNA polymerase sigma factor (sigma-70 family)
MNPGHADVPDEELLDRFARSADQAAFELLVWRHGAMVWGVCRRILGPDRDAAEDACQAAFVALAKHAIRLRGRCAVGAWLHRVAVRAAIDLGRIAARRCPADHPEPPARDMDPSREASDREVRALLDTGLNRLPDKLRVPFVLCELEGRTNAEAAAVLGCPVGTVESRLTRARRRLRDWLTARGVVPAVATAAVALPESTRTAMVRAADPMQPSAAVKALAVRAIPPALSAKVRAVIAAGLVLAAGAVALGMTLGEEGDRGDRSQAKVVQPPPQEQDPVIHPAGGVGPGEVVEILVMEAAAGSDGQVTFVVPHTPAPDKPVETFLTVRVDGKELRAVGVDGQPLDTAELVRRVPKWTAVAVVPAELGVPDPTYSKVLAERSVIFLVPRSVFAPMAKVAGTRRKWEGPRP